MTLPKDWLTAKIAKPKTKKKVTARVDMSEEIVGKGLCPSCKNPLVGPVFCSGKPMMVCWEDRVVMPYKDKIHTEIARNFKPVEVSEVHNPFGYEGFF